MAEQAKIHLTHLFPYQRPSCGSRAREIEISRWNEVHSEREHPFVSCLQKLARMRDEAEQLVCYIVNRKSVYIGEKEKLLLTREF